MNWHATITERDYQALHRHLFQSEHDEPAAFLHAGLTTTPAGQQLLIRRVIPVPPEDLGPSDRGGHRQISARAVARAALACDTDGLCLLWAHGHPDADRLVGFSQEDRDSHAFAHPALIDMTHGRPVAGLVFGANSVAGEVWTAHVPPDPLASLRVLGHHLHDLRPQPTDPAAPADERFARQVLLFGDQGQALLRQCVVAVVGAGGGGSLLIQMLAHLGVGRLLIIDYDHVTWSNLSRIVGATPRDAELRRRKIDVMRDLVHRIDPSIQVDTVYGDITYQQDARRVADANFAFLATDTVFSRYAFNLVCHQYLIPGIQIGAKVTGDPTTGAVDLIHVMERLLTLDHACLDCAGVIPADALAREQLSKDERRAQDYVDGAGDEQIEDPSVITLNAISAAQAATDFLLMTTGLLPEAADLNARVFHPQERVLRGRPATMKLGCRWCDPRTPTSVFARGDLRQMALRPESRQQAV